MEIGYYILFGPEWKKVAGDGEADGFFNGNKRTVFIQGHTDLPLGFNIWTYVHETAHSFNNVIKTVCLDSDFETQFVSLNRNSNKDDYGCFDEDKEKYSSENCTALRQQIATAGELRRGIAGYADIYGISKLAEDIATMTELAYSLGLDKKSPQQLKILSKLTHASDEDLLILEDKINLLGSYNFLDLGINERVNARLDLAPEVNSYSVDVSDIVCPVDNPEEKIELNAGTFADLLEAGSVEKINSGIFDTPWYWTAEFPCRDVIDGKDLILIYAQLPSEEILKAKDLVQMLQDLEFIENSEKETIFDLFSRLEQLGDQFRQIYSTYPQIGSQTENCPDNCQVGLPKFKSVIDYSLYLDWQNIELMIYYPNYGYAFPQAMKNMSFDIAYTIHYLNDINQDLEKHSSIDSSDYFIGDNKAVKDELNQQSHLEIFNKKVEALHLLGLIPEEAYWDYQDVLNGKSLQYFFDHTN